MPELFTILIKVNIALVLFCAGYYLVLRKLTFYTLNRAYLITGILCSSLYPFVDPAALMQRYRDIFAPVQNVVIIWQAPAEKLVRQAVYWNWLEMLFWAGAIVFAARLIFQLISLYKLYLSSTPTEINGQNVRVVKGDISPFSFWKSIYINPEKLSSADLKNVLAHEQVHVDEWHTIDILLAEISVIFYWFNPGIWMMKRAVRENIEFITDRKILQKGMDSKAYQYSLLNITFNQPAPAVTSNFNLSTLKKRIMMMNAKRSSKITLTRYALLVPVVVVCLLVFSFSKAEAVKINPAFKAVKEVVKAVNGMVLNIDTVPAVTKNITGTVTLQKGVNGTTKTITLKGADVNNLTITIDSPKVERHTVTISGGPSQKDNVIAFGLSAKQGDTYNTSGLTSAQTINGDSALLRRNTMLKGLTTYNYRTTADGLHVVVPDKAFGLTNTGYAFSVGTVDTKPATTYTTKDAAAKNDKLTEVTVIGRPAPAAKNDKLTEVTVIGRPSPAKSITGIVDTANRKYVNGFYANLAFSNNTKTATTVTGKQRKNGNDTILLGKVTPTFSAYQIVTTDPNGKQVIHAQPLFIVDGKEVDQKDLKSFEGKVTYLGGDAAVEKYGEKGKNGVVIIATKKGK